MAEIWETDDTDEDTGNFEELVENLRQSNEVLRAENEILEHYLNRLVSRDKKRQPDSDSRGHQRKPKSQTQGQEKPAVLTMEQRCHVAETEICEIQKDMENFKQSSERVMLNYKATMEEADIRLAEVKKARSNFEQDVVKPLQERKGPVKGTEKVMRFIEEQINAKKSKIQRLRLKNAELCKKSKKLQEQQQQQQELAKEVQEVDFQHLVIENKNCLEQIDKFNQDLLHLKQANPQQSLNTYKKTLQSLTSESKQLDSDIASRKKMLMRIEEELLQSEQERLQAEILNRKLRDKLATFQVPDVQQYISANASHRQLEESVRSWERKVQVAEMNLKTSKKTWAKLQAVTEVGSVHPH